MAKQVKDPGVGFSSNKKAKRFINSDGSFNVKHINRKKSLRRSYNYLINISWLAFFGWVFLGYTAINVLFALMYLAMGIESISPATGSWVEDFFNAFFFSAQTLTSVGYGTLSPSGIAYGILSSFEALVGLLSFSFVTGLLYGRFSKPVSSIAFSDTLIIKKHKGEDAMMFRLMSRNKSVMILPKVEVTLTLTQKNEENKYVNHFYRLNLERKQVTYLPTTWTIVHPISEDSPLARFDRTTLSDLHGEVLILVSYYDESFAQDVHQIHSYTLNSLQIDKAFEKAFYYDEEGYTILDHDRLSHLKEE